MLPTRSFMVLENTVLADQIFLLSLKPADGGSLFPFRAGQWIGLTLPDGPAPYGRKIAAFSIASAPIESDGFIELVIKITGPFTQAASELAVGATVGIQGPYGAFTLPPDADAVTCFAAGVGVAPMRSMIRQTLLAGEGRRVRLFYSSRGDMMPLEDEFHSLAKTYPAFSFIPCKTGSVSPVWTGERRRIDDRMVQRYGGYSAGEWYYMCGPDAFMDELRQMLVTAGVDVRARMRRESFT